MTPTLETRLYEAVARVRQHWRGTRLIDGLEPGVEGTRALLDVARIYRANRLEIGRMRPLLGRAVAGLFFDPSLRTHTSMEVATGRCGAHFVYLQGGEGTWKMEFDEGVVMDGNTAEHVKEAAPVLSSYADVLAVRAFPRAHNRDETVIRAFSRYAGAPLINLESALAHPCQGLADQLTLADLGGGNSFQGKKVCLTWAPHPKPLPQAVPLSVVRAAILGGADLHVACPEGFDLDEEEMERVASFAGDTGARLTLTRDQAAATQGALAVYAKGWAATDREQHAALAAKHRHWTVGDDAMKSATAFLHCLPVRRNVIVTDSVLDGPKSRVIPQAANREPVQAALLLSWLL